MQNDIHVTAGAQDCMNSIAERTGFFWSTLWFHVKNAELRERRGNPNVLLPGDSVYIPPLAMSSVDRPTNLRHTFVRKGVPSVFRLRLTKNDKPLSGLAYVLTIDGVDMPGSTDGDGRIEVPISPNAQSGRLVVGSGPEQRIYELNLGAAIPATEDAGALGRLEALGFHGGPDPEQALQTALKSFQVGRQLPVTGELDTATQAALKQAFGC